MNHGDMKQKLWAANLRYPVPKQFNKNEYLNAGVISKEYLVDGCYYYGLCRNARVAKWFAKRQCFVYMRAKLGSIFPEDIYHLEDDNGYDIFLPFGLAEESDLMEEEKI